MNNYLCDLIFLQENVYDVTYELLAHMKDCFSKNHW